MNEFAPSVCYIAGEPSSDHSDRFRARERQIEARTLALAYLREHGGRVKASDLVAHLADRGWTQAGAAADLARWPAYIVAEHSGARNNVRAYELHPHLRG
jgi:hypothetical protein